MMFRTRTPGPEPKEPEADIQRDVMNQLQLDRWLVVRVNSGGFRDRRGILVKSYIIQGLNAIAGFPDVLALRGDVKGGRFLLLEIKTLTGKVTPAQARFHKFARRFGITVHIVRRMEELTSIYKMEEP